MEVNQFRPYDICLFDNKATVLIISKLIGNHNDIYCASYDYLAGFLTTTAKNNINYCFWDNTSPDAKSLFFQKEKYKFGTLSLFRWVRKEKYKFGTLSLFRWVRNDELKLVLPSSMIYGLSDFIKIVILQNKI